jgi:hypothetical protein
MKKVFLFWAFMIFLVMAFSCRRKGNETLRSGGLTSEMLLDSTTVAFPEVEYYFDTIQQGDIVEHTFAVKNTGEKNLYIANAFGSCGCTVPEYPKEPIPPGKTAQVKVTFNSAGKEGNQNKTITLVMNTSKRSEVLYLKGYVKPKM